MEQETPDITFGRSAEAIVLDVFDMYVGTDELIRDQDTGEPVPGWYDDEPVGIRNFGGMVRKDGEPRPIRQNFVEVSEYVDREVRA